MREKVGKSRNTVFFPMIVCSGGSKSRLAKAAGCGAIWPDERWKIARRCGSKHISKSKCTKHIILGPLLEVEMSKKCTPVWHEAHFEVKMYTTHHCRTTFGSWDVEKVHAVVARSTFEIKMYKTPQRRPLWSWDVEKVHAVVARSTFRSQNVQNTGGSDTFGCWDVASRGRRKGWYTLSKVSKPWGFCSIFNYNHHYTTLHSIHYTTLQLQLHLHYILLHYTALNYTQLHYTTLHYTTLHYLPLHFTTLHYTTLHNTTTTTTQLHSTNLHYTKLHSTTLHYTTLHSTTLHYITPTRHYLPLHFTTLHYTTLHYTTLHSTTLHYITLHDTTFHCTSLHYTTLHYIKLHDTTFHYTSLHHHYTTLHNTKTTLHNYTPLH